jgi:acyl carrier protein
MKSVNQTVCDVLAYHVNRDVTDFDGSDLLYGDLGLSLLGVALVVLDIEDELGVRLSVEALGARPTVGHVIALVHKAIAFDEEAPTERSAAPDFVAF